MSSKWHHKNFLFSSPS